MPRRKYAGRGEYYIKKHAGVISMTDYRNWLTAVSTAATDLETLTRFARCGINAVELSLSWDEYDSVDWQAFRRNAAEAGIITWSLHLPFAGHINIASTDDAERRRTVEYHKSLIDLAAGIGISRFIIHPSAEPLPDAALEGRPRWLTARNMSEAELADYIEQLKTMDREACMAAAKSSLAELAEHAAGRGGIICVEDLPRTCLGHTAVEMLELLSADERLRVCFDVNHLLTEYGTTHTEFVEKLGKYIVTTHMSDYDFEDEKHFFPGVGMLDWKTTIEALEKADYTGPFLYEGGFSPSSRVPEAPYGRFEEARERHMRIKEFTGKDHIG